MRGHGKSYNQEQGWSKGGINLDLSWTDPSRAICPIPDTMRDDSVWSLTGGMGLGDRNKTLEHIKVLRLED